MVISAKHGMATSNPKGASVATLLLDVSCGMIYVLLAVRREVSGTSFSRLEKIEKEMFPQKDVGNGLILLVNNVLKQAKLNLSSLSAIAIVSGPGSYTALRVAASIAKIWCIVHGIRLFAFSKLELYALNFFVSDPCLKKDKAGADVDWKDNKKNIFYDTPIADYFTKYESRQTQLVVAMKREGLKDEVLFDQTLVIQKFALPIAASSSSDAFFIKDRVSEDADKTWNRRQTFRKICDALKNSGHSQEIDATALAIIAEDGFFTDERRWPKTTSIVVTGSAAAAIVGADAMPALMSATKRSTTVRSATLLRPIFFLLTKKPESQWKTILWNALEVVEFELNEDASWLNSTNASFQVEAEQFNPIYNLHKDKWKN